ncbi:MAG: type I methionyl aminopeptidase [Schleiferiaceae bacterium]|nr:type I methionyl aminopeptidase [Schleiferiaceae bacterium]
MIKYKTPEEIEKMRAAAQVVSRTLGMLAAEIKPGASPVKLDKMAEEYIREQGAVPGFLGLYDCPSTLLISRNETVVHGLPVSEPLHEGDIVSVDCGALLDGYYGDHAYTYEVGEVAPATRKLLQVTKEALYKGIEQMRAGQRLGDVSHAIQQHAESYGYGVVRELVGHGIGTTMHEDPQVPNFGRQGRGKKLKEGLTLAIEPMITMGSYRVKQLSDGWTINTVDGKPAAHFEHDVAIVNGAPDILSTFDYIYEALGTKEET